ncbi:MAG TPA: 50S ribosomal protein L21 [Ktedonobacteraceae bacterium]|nr:50S ribosomal protein L21 [Ktedonobacteraceae bacterium]
MFAVIKSGGRQYKVSVGETLEVNRLSVADGEQIRIGEVLLISDEGNVMIGAPYVDNALVLATVEKQARGKKIIVFKYKSKKRYRRRTGHRQELTVLTIDDIVADGKSLITGKEPQFREALSEDEEIEAEEAAEMSEAEETEAEAQGEEVSSEPKTSRRRHAAKVEETESDKEEE